MGMYLAVAQKCGVGFLDSDIYYLHIIPCTGKTYVLPQLL